MALLQGVDYSFSRPNLPCMWNNGQRYVIRYLSNTNSSKNTSRGEVDALKRQGFKVVLVYEDTAGAMLRGYDEGVADARVAKDFAARVGCPTNRPIYFALDVDPNPLSNSQMAACQAYLNGCADVLGARRVGLYAGWRGIENLNCAWYWQTYAWSGGRRSGKAHFRQYKNGVDMCGGEVDLNEAYKSDFGQWPLTVQEDWFDMASKAELKDAVREELRDAWADNDAIAERAQARMQEELDQFLPQVTAKVRQVMESEIEEWGGEFRTALRGIAEEEVKDAVDAVNAGVAELKTLISNLPQSPPTP
jgi:hypothetical protein